MLFMDQGSAQRPAPILISSLIVSNQESSCPKLSKKIGPAYMALKLQGKIVYVKKDAGPNWSEVLAANQEPYFFLLDKPLLIALYC